MSPTPIFDAVVRDLRVNPASIVARPRWTFDAANARALAVLNKRREKVKR